MLYATYYILYTIYHRLRITYYVLRTTYYVLYTKYAQTLIVVALIVVNFFSCLNITRPHDLGLGPNLSRSNLQVSRSFLDTIHALKTARKRKRSNFKLFEENEEKNNDY